MKNKFIDTFDWKLFGLLATMYSLAFIVFSFIVPAYLLAHSNNMPVTDILISNLPAIDMSFMFVYGYFVPQSLLMAYLVLRKNFKTFFYFYFITIFATIVRSIFNMMTHMQAPHDAIASKYLPSMFLENDLFFSGHVAIPFLYFLIFKKVQNKIATNIFLIFTILMGITVIFMKVHYTIDVASAPFIVFGIFYLSDKFLQSKFGINITDEFKK